MMVNFGNDQIALIGRHYQDRWSVTTALDHHKQGSTHPLVHRPQENYPDLQQAKR
uniref:Uncharacterized protein n=1 Tax=Arion vulgaris TaxID=1028688 RepID=A0A0B7A2P7_9EUPU